MMVFNRNQSQVFTSKCGPSAMSSSPRSSSSSWYHEVNNEVSRIYFHDVFFLFFTRRTLPFFSFNIDSYGDYLFAISI